MHKRVDENTYKQIMIEKYFDTVYRLALSQTQERHRADDVLQEVFLRYIRSDKLFESEEHIKAWLIRVTINCSKSSFTTAWSRRTVPLSEDITFEMPEQEELYLTVAKLPKKYRAVIHLFYYEDLSVKDIAKCLKLKESTFKSQLHRAREMLRQMLEGRSEIEF